MDVLIPASSRVRCINFLIDSTIWLVLFFSLAYILDRYVVRFNSYVVNYIYSFLLAVITYLGYYIVLEHTFQRTVGKWISRTRVVEKSGGKLTFSSVVKRSFTKLIPIDMIYYLFLSSGLHDKWSNTMVVKTG